MNDSDASDPSAEMDHGSARTSPVEDLGVVLLELARSATEDEPSEVLESVTNAIFATSGYRTVVLNVFRPAWDDYEAVFVTGGQESSDTLLGSTVSRDVVERLVATGSEVLPGVHLLTEETAVWTQIDRVFTPDIPDSADPDAWRSEDALLVMLRDVTGGPLGFLSVDEPTSRLRPSTAELRLLRIVCSYAEQALRSAQRSRRAELDKQLLERLSRVSPRFSRCGSRDELYSLLTTVSAASLGFERVGLYTGEDPLALTLRQSRGPGEADPFPTFLQRARLARILDPERGHLGCWLIDASELYGDTAFGSRRSPRNGAGPLAWADQVLIIPWWRDPDALDGVLVVDDPADHLIPSDEHRSAARLLVDLAASVSRAVAQQERLVEQASFDALTGLRNRRGLHRLIMSGASVAVLLCDIDHFKAVNDDHGHASGDNVLRVFGAILSELTTGDEVAVRLGGEEFCVVLPDTDVPSALALAERIRSATSDRTRAVISGGVTVSVGVATSADPVTDARRLLAVADRRLYAAKRTGRDRVVAED